MPEECKNCLCWDYELEGCTMPSIDKSYACPLYDFETGRRVENG